MTMKVAIKIFFAALVLFVLEFLVYVKTGMPRALASNGLAMVAAYKFLWLMVMTGVAGLLAPLSAMMDGSPEKKFGLVGWIALILIAMQGFTVFSFIKAPSSAAPSSVSVFPVKVAATPPPAAPPPAPKAPEAIKEAAAPTGQKAAEFLQFTSGDAEQLDPESIRMTLHFDNKSKKAITQMDYTFGCAVGSELVFKMNMREDVYFPPGMPGKTSLTWKKSAFKTPELFEKLKTGTSSKTIRIFAPVTQVVLEDGTVAKSETNT